MYAAILTFLGVLSSMIVIILMLSCSRPDAEMATLSEDVLKAKQGVDIQVKPLPKDPPMGPEFRKNN